ncbi:hypothetical protein ACC685_33435 [Rhizobium ruizarguesonis]
MTWKITRQPEKLLTDADRADAQLIAWLDTKPLSAEDRAELALVADIDILDRVETLDRLSRPYYLQDLATALKAFDKQIPERHRAHVMQARKHLADPTASAQRLRMWGKTINAIADSYGMRPSPEGERSSAIDDTPAPLPRPH